MVRSTSITPPVRGEPPWDIARLYPAQGSWSEEEFHAWDAGNNNLVEFTDGFVEVLEMPKVKHQEIVHQLFRLLDAFVIGRSLGKVYMAPTKLRIRPGKIREPDVLFLPAGCYRRTDDYFEGASLVIEVVSPDPESQRRDWTTKVADYAEGGIAEYWIVDPQQEKITVLRLTPGGYITDNEAGPTGTARSALLSGFEVDAESLWAAGRAD